MARWTDLAVWVGHTTNEGDGDGTPLEADDRLSDVRGLVLHIASGFYEGTIAWQRNASANVSSHFIVGRDGRCAQMVDTADRSWAQRSGNSTWLSVELEGFAPDDPLHASHPGWERLTDAQIEVCAQLFARAHRVYGVAKVPLQLATSPAGRGLGHHSMGAESGIDWGHSQCPGEAIKSQKPAILAQAIQIVNGDEMSEWHIGLTPAGLRDDQTTQGTLEVGGQPGNLDHGHVGQHQRDTVLAMAAERAWAAWNGTQQILDRLGGTYTGVSLTPADLQAAVISALQSPEGQAAIKAAANAAEDS